MIALYENKLYSVIMNLVLFIVLLNCVCENANHLKNISLLCIHCFMKDFTHKMIRLQHMQYFSILR